MPDITPNQPLTKLFNPLSRDFTVTYDIHGDGQPVSFTIHAEEIEEFPNAVAVHLENHLGYEVAMQIKGRGTFEDAKQRALLMIRKPVQDLEEQLA